MMLEPTRSGGRRRHSPGIKEVLLASLALAVVAGFVYLPHIRHGGFYLDDWPDAAATLYPLEGPGLGHVLSYFGDLFPYRPALILYIPLKYYVFGANMALQLAWTVALGLIAAVLLYGILRFLGVPWYHALLIVALTIVYPWFDSTRFWEAASLSIFAIVLALGGLWVALVGLERRSWLLHAAVAALYLVSILTYEITLPFIAAAGMLYVLCAGWRAARARWGVDLAVVASAGLWNALHTNREVSGISGDLTHLKAIAIGGGTILGRTVYPLGPHGYTTMMLVLLGAVLAAAAILYLANRDPRGEATGWGLHEWLALAAGGLVVAALGWAMFVPAASYYTPSVYGFSNRVNALAGLGLVIVAYAAAGVGVTLVARFLPKLRKAVPVAIVTLGLLLGAAYVHVVERHSGIWDTAYRAERMGMDRIKATFPDLPPETSVITSDYPAYQTLGVPVFAAGWDLNGMIKLEYEDPTLSAVPLIPGIEMECRAGGVGVHGTETPDVTTPYGRVRFLNLQTGRHATPHSRRQCEAVSDLYVPGPQYLSYGY